MSVELIPIRNPFDLVGGSIAVTQSITDKSTKLATTAFIHNVNYGTVVELDFGITPIKWKKFTVTDSNIVSTDIVDCKLAYLQPTGKSLDEVEMDSFYILSKPFSGGVVFNIKSLEGHVKGKFKFRYQVLKG